jgi:hypothetical protein
MFGDSINTLVSAVVYLQVVGKRALPKKIATPEINLDTDRLELKGIREAAEVLKTTPQLLSAALIFTEGVR